MERADVDGRDQRDGGGSGSDVPEFAGQAMVRGTDRC